jgi:hypothetical protein
VACNNVTWSINKTDEKRDSTLRSEGMAGETPR